MQVAATPMRSREAGRSRRHPAADSDNAQCIAAHRTPQPTRPQTADTSRHPRVIVSGIAAPPEMQVRRDEVSAAAAGSG